MPRLTVPSAASQRRGRMRRGGVVTAIGAMLLAAGIAYAPAASAADSVPLSIDIQWWGATAGDVATIVIRVDGTVVDTKHAAPPDGDSGPDALVTVQVPEGAEVEIAQSVSTAAADYVYDGTLFCGVLPMYGPFEMPGSPLTCQLSNAARDAYAPYVEKYVELERPDANGTYTTVSTDADGMTAHPGDRLTYRLEIHAIDPYTGSVAVDDLSALDGVDFSAPNLSISDTAHVTAVMRATPLALVLTADALPPSAEVTVRFSGIVLDAAAEGPAEIVNVMDGRAAPGNGPCEGLRCAASNPVVALPVVESSTTSPRTTTVPPETSAVSQPTTSAARSTPLAQTTSVPPETSVTSPPVEVLAATGWPLLAAIGLGVMLLVAGVAVMGSGTRRRT